MKARSTLQYAVLHIGTDRIEKRKAFTELPPALWKSNYCDNIHGNQANRWKKKDKKQQRYWLFVASIKTWKHEQYLQVIDLTVSLDNKLLVFTVR